MAKPVPIAFLKVKGIPGSCVRKGFEEQITVIGYEHAMIRAFGKMHDATYVPQHLQALGAQLGNPKEAHRPFTVVKSMDRASVLLFAALNENKEISDPVELSVLQSVQGGEIVAMKISLHKAVIQAIEYQETSGEGNVERVSFAYTAIEWEYTGLDEAGKRTGSLNTRAELGTR